MHNISSTACNSSCCLAKENVFISTIQTYSKQTHFGMHILTTFQLSWLTYDLLNKVFCMCVYVYMYIYGDIRMNICTHMYYRDLQTVAG